MKALRCLELVKEDQGQMTWLDLFKWQENNFMDKNPEIRVDWRNVANELGNLGEVNWCWLFYGGMVS